MLLDREGEDEEGEKDEEDGVWLVMKITDFLSLRPPPHTPPLSPGFSVSFVQPGSARPWACPGDGGAVANGRVRCDMGGSQS